MELGIFFLLYFKFELVTCGPNMPIEFWDCDQVEPVE